MPQLTTRTAKRLEGLIKNRDKCLTAMDGYRTQVIIDEISSVKNELKEIHDSEECSCHHDENNPCGYGILIQEIESLEERK